jgi:uncharacterized repeat protein (TIGR01451 family)
MRTSLRSSAIHVLAALALGLLSSTAAMAKSLYVIGDINANPTPIRTYDVQSAPAHLVFQATSSVPDWGWGAVGMAIDTDNKKLFITYEQSNVIQLLNATNFANLGTTTAPGANDLAGITVDQGKGKVYSVDRNTNHLYIYTWNSATNTLTLDGGAFRTLPGVTRAYGLALDEARGRLYVGDVATQTVRYFDTTTWGHAGEFALAASAQTVGGIAVDTRRNTVYTGNPYEPDGSKGRLVKYDLNTNTETFYTLPGAAASNGDNILGIAVDEDTGNVYATTGNRGSGGTDTLIAFDQNLTVLKNDFGDLGAPTGLAIPRAPVSFNPLNFSKTGSINPIATGSNLTYTLCYDNRANTAAVANVRITDTLPAGVAFVSATGSPTVAGQVVTWTIGTVAAGAAQACNDLVVTVNAAPGGSVLNSATITSDNTPPTTQTVLTDVIGGYVALNLTKIDSVHPVVTGRNLTHTICVDGGANTQTVNNVVLTDPLPAGLVFVSATGGGTFDGAQVRWTLGNILPEAARVCVDVTWTVNAAPGAVILNTVTAVSDNTPAQSVTHDTDVIADYKLPNLSIDDGTPTVRTGSTLTINVCFDNSANATLPLANVVIASPLPEGTTFVSASGPSAFANDTVTWTVGTLAAAAPQTCYAMVVQVTAPAGKVIAGAATLTNDNTVAVSAAHRTDVIAAIQSVVIEGEGEGGGGAVGLLELLFGAAAIIALALHRRGTRSLWSVALLAGMASLWMPADDANAAGPGPYVGIGGGQSVMDASAGDLDGKLAGLGYTTRSTMDDKDSGFKLFGGYRFSPYLGVEASYVHLGKVTSVIRSDIDPALIAPLVNDVTRVHPFSISGPTLAVMGMVPIPLATTNCLSVFGKLGAIRWDAKVHAVLVPAGAPRATLREKGTGAMYGAGISCDMANGLGVRVEWERFQTSRNDPQLYSVGLSYSF